MPSLLARGHFYIPVPVFGPHPSWLLGHPEIQDSVLSNCLFSRGGARLSGSCARSSVELGHHTVEVGAPWRERHFRQLKLCGNEAIAGNGPQLTPEQEAARWRVLAAAQIPLENPEKAAGPSI
jgi:hypothetical protein